MCVRVRVFLVSGVVTTFPTQPKLVVDTYTGDLFVEYKVSADPACTAEADKSSNKCGLHLHTGTCAAVGAHAYNTADSRTDPWGFDTTAYTHNVWGLHGPVVTGYTTLDQVYDFVLVVHNQAGQKIACLPVKNPGQDSAATASVSAATLGALAVLMLAM